MTLQELIESDRMRIGDSVDYKPDVGKFIADPNNTGFEEVQILETQKNAEYILWDYDDIEETVKLTTRRFVNPIMLYGIKGYFNGPKELHRLCETNYSSKRLEVKARSMTVEDYIQKYVYKTPSNPKRIAFCYEGPYVDERVFNGNTYGTMLAPRNSRFYSADGGGIIKKDENGFEFRIPTLNNPVFITENYFHQSRDFNFGEPWDEAWLASPCIHLFNSCKDVFYSLRSVSSSDLGAALLFYSYNSQEVRATNGVHPIITLSSQTLIKEQREVGRPWELA